MICIIKMVDDKYKVSTLDFIQEVFTNYKNIEEGLLVRSLVEEIRQKNIIFKNLN